MPLYKEETKEVTTVTTTFERAYKITVNYPNKGTPSIRFDLEKIERKDDKDRSIGITGYFEESLNPDNKDTTFNLIDEQGNVIGSFTYEGVQAVLYGLFFHLAAKREE